MTENYIVSLVVWIILYASFWLTKHNPVSTAFRRRECHTGFLAKWLEKTIFPFRWYVSRPTYEYAIGLLLLCCILFTVSLHISVAHFDLPQIYFDTVYEHCRFTFISGICAVFSSISKVAGMEVKTIFTSADLPDYQVYNSHECELCKEGQKLTGLINSFGFVEL